MMLAIGASVVLAFPMRLVPNYRSADEVFAAIDKGSGFSSKANDGILSASELRKAAGQKHAAELDSFLQHILWDLPPKDIERIRASVPPALLDTVLDKRTNAKDPWHAQGQKIGHLQVVTTTGVLRPLNDQTIENIRVSGANDLTRPMEDTLHSTGVGADLLSESLGEVFARLRRRAKRIGDVFWLYQWIQQVDMSTAAESWPLVLSPKKQPRIPFSQPVRLTAVWGNLEKASVSQRSASCQDDEAIELGEIPFHTFGSKIGIKETTWNYMQRSDGRHKDSAYSHEHENQYSNMRVLFCTPLDDDEATQMCNAEGNNARDVSAELLRQALAPHST